MTYLSKMLKVFATACWKGWLSGLIFVCTCCLLNLGVMNIRKYLPCIFAGIFYSSKLLTLNFLVTTTGDYLTQQNSWGKELADYE